MNRRTLKKLCQKAKAKLITDHGYREADFEDARGDECVSAPPRMECRFVAYGSYVLDPGPLRGTPLLWSDDGDASLPTDVLAECEYWANLSDEELKRMAAES